MTYSGTIASSMYPAIYKPPCPQPTSGVAKWIPQEASMTVNCRRGVSRLSSSRQKGNKHETKEISDTNKVTELHKKVDPFCGVQVKVGLVSLWGGPLAHVETRISFAAEIRICVYGKGCHGSCFRHEGFLESDKM